MNGVLYCAALYDQMQNKSQMECFTLSHWKTGSIAGWERVVDGTEALEQDSHQHLGAKHAQNIAKHSDSTKKALAPLHAGDCEPAHVVNKTAGNE